MINQLRMSEIAEVLADRIAEYDSDFAREVLIDKLDMSDEELNYFGISKADLEIEDEDEDEEEDEDDEDETPCCGDDILLDWDL